jgi:hypothetical protein
MRRTTKKRKPKTVTTPSFRALLPRCFGCGFRNLLLGSLLSLLCATSAGAAGSGSSPDPKHDKPYALIFGTVWGPDARPVYGVKIRIRRESEKKPRWELYSDHSGEFAQRVPAAKADYVIWADLKGYKSPSGLQVRQSEEVTVHVEYDEKVDTGVHLK